MLGGGEQLGRGQEGGRGPAAEEVYERFWGHGAGLGGADCGFAV